MARYKIVDSHNRTIVGFNRYGSATKAARILAWERGDVQIIWNGRIVDTMTKHPRYYGPSYTIHEHTPIRLQCGGETPSIHRHACDRCLFNQGGVNAKD